MSRLGTSHTTSSFCDSGTRSRRRSSSAISASATGTLAPSDPFVIAINASEIDCARAERFVPDIVCRGSPLRRPLPHDRSSEREGSRWRTPPPQKEILKRVATSDDHSLSGPGIRLDFRCPVFGLGRSESARRTRRRCHCDSKPSSNSEPDPGRSLSVRRHYVVSLDGLTLTPEYRSPVGSRLLFEKELFGG